MTTSTDGPRARRRTSCPFDRRAQPPDRDAMRAARTRPLGHRDSHQKMEVHRVPVRITTPGGAANHAADVVRRAHGLAGHLLHDHGRTAARRADPRHLRPAGRHGRDRRPDGHGARCHRGVRLDRPAAGGRAARPAGAAGGPARRDGRGKHRLRSRSELHRAAGIPAARRHHDRRFLGRRRQSRGTAGARTVRATRTRADLRRGRCRRRARRAGRHDDR